MRIALASASGALGLVSTLVGCGTERPTRPTEPSPSLTMDAPRGRADFAWSEPVWLGPVVNSTATDNNPVVSPNGRSLYFASDRGGDFDIWVSRRARPGCPWGAPVNIGAPVNTDATEGEPRFSRDGNLMFFASNRLPTAGGRDIWVSRRTGADDLAWGEPENLGAGVNTALLDVAAEYDQTAGELYFQRSPGGPGASVLHAVPATHDGRALGEARLVPELDAPGVADGMVSISSDGRELFFWSGGRAGERPGGVGLADIWVSTRQGHGEPWSAPRNIGRPVNHEGPDLNPSISDDGRTLVFQSMSETRGGLGSWDIWMSTRGPADPPQGEAGCSP